MTDRELAAKFEEYGVPPAVAENIEAYIAHGHEPGGWLCSVFENDLSRAVGNADSTNLPALPAIVKWIYNWAPVACWGSPAKVRAWIRQRGVESW